MSQQLVDLIATAMWDAVGMPSLFGLIVLGVLFFFLIRNRVDRGGLALLGVLVLGFMARPVALGGFGMIDSWIFYVVIAAAGVFAALGFINVQREA